MNVMVVGATGNVGRQIVDMIPVVHGVSVKKVAKTAREDVQALQDVSFHAADWVIFATDASVSREYVPKALAAGCCVIDTSSAFRMDPKVPLIVAPVNGHRLLDRDSLISTSNCLTSPLSIILSALLPLGQISQVVVTTFQSVSGAGCEAMSELTNQTKNPLERDPQILPRPIAFNVIPQVGAFDDDGWCEEETKIIQETQKVLGCSLNIIPTTVRVPVYIGHSLSITVTYTQESPSLQEVTEALESTYGIRTHSSYPTPVECVGRDDITVGKIRRTNNTLNLWSVSDNLRRGAALDVIEILALVKEHELRLAS